MLKSTQILKSLQYLQSPLPTISTISTLSNFGKLFESITYSQLNDYMENKFSKYFTGFRKNDNTQSCLLRIIESGEAQLNHESKVVVIMMGLSKAFDSLNHDLLLAEVKTYALYYKAVSFMRLYLTNRLQWCKRNNSSTEWGKISAGVPQGSILGPLLFIIFINDIFLFLQKFDLANYADDSTMYASDKRVSTMIDSLSNEFNILSKWFYNNFMVLNPDKCSCMLSGQVCMWRWNF